MTPPTLLFCLCVLCCLPGCAAHRPPAEPAQSATQVAKAQPLDTDALITWVQTHRDQPFARGVVFAPLPLEALPPQEPVAAGLQAQADLLTTRFAPGDGAPLGHRRFEVARYDAPSDSVQYAAGTRDQATLKLALVGALVDALHARRWPVVSKPEALDAALAHTLVPHGSATLLMLLYHLQRAGHPEVTLTQLTAQPAYLRAHPELFPPLLLPRQGQGGWDTHLGGLELVGALWRSQGWTGVEMALAQPPEETRFLAQPERWMAGDGAAVWRWPKGVVEAAWPGYSPKLTFSPGLLWWQSLVCTHQTEALGLGQDDAQAWIADTLTVYTHPTHGARQIWLLHWSTQEAASRAAALLSLAMKAQGLVGEVAAAQTKTVVLLRPQAPEVPSEPTLGLLMALSQQVTLSVPPREGFALPYVPTPQERLEGNQRAMTLDRGLGMWRAPDLGVSVSLEALAGYEVQMTRQDETLRWWARAPDGQTMVQLGMAAVGPLYADFSSKAYGPQFEESFGQVGLKNTTLTRVRQTPIPSLGESKGWAMEMAFEQGGQPQRVHTLYFPTKDEEIVGMLSVTTTPERSGAAVALMAALTRGLSFVE